MLQSRGHTLRRRDGLLNQYRAHGKLPLCGIASVYGWLTFLLRGVRYYDGLAIFESSRYSPTRCKHSDGTVDRTKRCLSVISTAGVCRMRLILCDPPQCLPAYNPRLNHALLTSTRTWSFTLLLVACSGCSAILSDDTR